MGSYLSDKEIEQLLTAIKESDFTPSEFSSQNKTKKYKIYNFKKPEKFNKQQIKNFRLLANNFAFKLKEFFNFNLGLDLSISTPSILQFTIEELERVTPKDSNNIPIRLDSFKSSDFGLLTFDSLFSDKILKQVCGYTINDYNTYAFSQTQKNLFKTFILDFPSFYENLFVFKDLFESHYQPKIIKEIKNFFFNCCQIGVLITFEYLINKKQEGVLTLFFPETFFNKTAKEKLKSSPFFIRKDFSNKGTIDLNKLKGTEIEINLRGYTKKSVKDILNLKKQDILNFDDLFSCVGDNKLFKIDGGRAMNKEEESMTLRADSIKLDNLEVEVYAVLGHNKISFKKLINLAEGSIIEFIEDFTEPVSIYANNVLIGKGEVVISDDDKFSVKITELEEKK